MQFTSLQLLAFAASATALNGAWNVTRSYSDISQQLVGYSLTAVFVSDEYPNGLESNCSWVEKGGPPAQGLECTPNSFSVEPQDDGSKYSSVTRKSTEDFD